MALLLDGAAMDDPAGRFYVLATSQVRNPPSVVVNDVSVPGQHGVLRSSSRVHGPGSAVLSMRVRGGTYAAMMANYSALMQRVGIQSTPRVLLDNEISQQAEVDLTSISEFQQVYRRMGNCTVTLAIPRAFWRDSADTTVSLGTGSGSMSPAALTGGSAPILDPIFVAAGNGASTDFRVTDTDSSAYFRYLGSVPAGQSVRIDPDSASAFLVDSANPWNGGADASGLLTVGPGQFSLSSGMAFVIAKTGTTATQLRARRAYL